MITVGLWVYSESGKKMDDLCFISLGMCGCEQIIPPLCKVNSFMCCTGLATITRPVYRVIPANINIASWSVAKETCEGNGMTLPAPDDILPVAELIRNYGGPSEYIWLDGECSWKTIEDGRSESFYI